jgi:methionyl-tRNA formyltransferase
VPQVPSAPAAPPLRIVFFGTAELACASLAALADIPAFSLVAVVTQPDRPKGRDLRLQPSPVKALALQRGLAVWQPARCRAPEFLDPLRAASPDLVVVAAYGQILPQALLDLPPHGCLNVHTSLLPRHRGAAPIQWAILDGDAETGVTIMQMDAGLDTGAVLAREATPILPADTAHTLHDRLAELGARLLVRTIPDHVGGRITPQPQPAEGATYARKITKEDGRLDWTQPAALLHRRLRALTPWPGTFTRLPEGGNQRLLKVWAAEVVPAPSGQPGEILSADAGGVLIRCGTDALRVTELQREGGRRLRAADFLAGHPVRSGAVLG